MFKQFSVIIISIFISYFISSYLLKYNYRRFYYINGIIKYPLKCSIKNAIYTPVSQLKLLDNYIFYSRETINCENYIYDELYDHYYLIEPGYYYYINKSQNGIVLNFNENSFVFVLKIK